MNSLTGVLERAARAVVRVAFLLLALGMAAAIVAAAVTVLLLASLWALLRGRRPPVVTVYRFSQQVSRQVWARGRAPFGAQAQGQRGGSGAAPRRQAASVADVVDVEMREVPDRPQPW